MTTISTPTRMMDQSIWDVLRPLLAQSGVRVFSHYGLSLHETDGPRATDHSLAAIIGFTGQHMRGHLTLTASPEMLHEAPPFPEAAVTDYDIHPWQGELSNQILGTLQKTLYDYQVKLELSIPELMQGQGLSLGGDHRCVQLVAASGRQLNLYFQAQLAPEVSLRFQPLPPEQRSTEGMVVL